MFHWLFAVGFNPPWDPAFFFHSEPISEYHSAEIYGNSGYSFGMINKKACHIFTLQTRTHLTKTWSNASPSIKDDKDFWDSPKNSWFLKKSVLQRTKTLAPKMALRRILHRLAQLTSSSVRQDLPLAQRFYGQCAEADPGKQPKRVIQVVKNPSREKPSPFRQCCWNNLQKNMLIMSSQS